MYRVMVYTQKPIELPKLHSQSFGLTKEQAEQFANRVNFAHSGFGLQEAFPTMLAKWREVGEQFFQAAQAAKLEQFQTA